MSKRIAIGLAIGSIVAAAAILGWNALQPNVELHEYQSPANKFRIQFPKGPRKVEERTQNTPAGPKPAIAVNWENDELEIAVYRSEHEQGFASKPQKMLESARKNAEGVRKDKGLQLMDERILKAPQQGIEFIFEEAATQTQVRRRYAWVGDTTYLLFAKTKSPLRYGRIIDTVFDSLDESPPQKRD